MIEKLFRCGFKVLAQSEELIMFGDLDKFGIGILVGVHVLRWRLGLGFMVQVTFRI